MEHGPQLSQHHRVVFPQHEHHHVLATVGQPDLIEQRTVATSDRPGCAVQRNTQLVLQPSLANNLYVVSLRLPSSSCSRPPGSSLGAEARRGQRRRDTLLVATAIASAESLWEIPRSRAMAHAPARPLPT